MNNGGSCSRFDVVTSGKDLGVWITSKPDFTLHCDNASSKAMQSLGLIKRTFTHLTKECFLILYKAYICPHLEYCVPIWNPYLSKSIEKLERIQQGATKLVASLMHLPYEERLQHLDLYSLYCHRQRGDLIEVYKLITSLSIVSPDPFFTFTNSSYCTRGHDQTISKQHCRINPRLITNKIIYQ